MKSFKKDHITTSGRFKCVIQKLAIPLDFLARRLGLFLWAFTSGATKCMLNKFGFIRFVKGEIFWMKTLKHLQRNGTIAQLSDLEGQSLQVYPFVSYI